MALSSMNIITFLFSLEKWNTEEKSADFKFSLFALISLTSAYPFEIGIEFAIETAVREKARTAKSVVITLNNLNFIIRKSPVITAKQLNRLMSANLNEGWIIPEFSKVRIFEMAPYSPPKMNVFTIPHSASELKRIVITVLILFPKR